MLDIGVLGVGKEHYYLRKVAAGVEDYYTGRGEAPGYWTGRAVASLGLAGRVDPVDLQAVLAGTDPRDADRAPLGRFKSGRSRPGFDLTFRAPKSVSLLWALSDDAISAVVCDAHDTAVAAALDYLEDAAGWSRRGAGGHEPIAGTGFVAAAFRHRASRAGDPLLHTHVLVANLSQARDDRRWRTLDARRLWTHAKTAGFLYQAQMRHELTARLGVAWQPVHNGHADIVGIDRDIVVAFSQRRQQIEQRLAERGETSARAAQVATLDTRRPKHDVDAATLTEGWVARADRLGVTRDTVAKLCGRRRVGELASAAVRAAIDATTSAEGVTKHRSVFVRRDVIMALCERLDAAADAPAILAAAGATLADGRVVTLDRTTTGTAARVGGPTYTTAELLRTERRLVSVAQRRRGTRVAVADDAAIAAAIDRRPSLTAEQASLVRSLCGGGDGVAVVVGKAGTGKTYALDAARDAWRQSASSVRVIGCALSGRAAQELADATGIRCSTIASLLGQLNRRDRRWQLAADTVVIVDEAGMVGTRHLAQLADHAAVAGAKLVLVGDHHQLPEIHAGGAFRALVDQLDGIELTTNRRQTHDWERATLDDLRTGEVDAALGSYRRHGRITAAETADDIRSVLVGDWWRAWQRDGPAGGLMVAVRVADVADLNARGRARLVAAGRLTGDAVTTRSGLQFQTGDRVVLRRGYQFRTLAGSQTRMHNGQRGTVTAVDPTHCQLTVVIDNQQTIIVPGGYIDDGHLEHGYAVTGHRAQGLTTQRCFVLGSDALYREWGYTAMSRGRHHNQLYIVTDDLDRLDGVDPRALAVDTRSSVERLRRWISRSQAQQLALDLTAPAPNDTHTAGRDHTLA